MKVKMILPALTEATGPFWRPIKYSLFPPLGLATLAAYLSPDDQIELQDEHVERLDLIDSPDLVVIQVYITSAYRAYHLADHYRRRGAHVALGGLHVTALPAEAARHAEMAKKYLDEGDAELNAMLGMEAAKREIKLIKSTTKVNLARAKMGLPVPVTSRHTLLLGPPGTGKTSVARAFSKQLCGLTVLRKPLKTGDLEETMRHLGRKTAGKSTKVA